MDLKFIISKRKLLLFTFIWLQWTNTNMLGQSWYMEYILEGDSSVYMLSHDKVIQGKSIDFFFPAYKFNQTASTKAIESVSIENNEVIEIEFSSKNIGCNNLNFEIDIYAEGIDSVWVFLKKRDDELVPLKRQILQQGYTYFPTIDFAVDLENADSKSIRIVGKSKSENKKSKIFLGRLKSSKKIGFISGNVQEVDSFISKQPFDQQSDLFYELPGNYLKSHDFISYTRLVLNDCYSALDSIQCISQFTNKLLNEYSLYDIYGIDKNELLNRNILLSESATNVDDYYKGMKEIIAFLNCCHIRLTTSQIEGVESPSQPVYFYNIKNEIVVTAIFDPTLNDKIQLGDKLISINNIPTGQLYKDFSKYVFASTPHQREMKITQRLLYTAMETWGDSLILEFQNKKEIYPVCLDKTNFSNKRVVPAGFKVASNNMIEIYNDIIYFRPDFRESVINPFLYSHKENFNNCKGLILDLRGNSGGDLSSSTFFSFLIFESAPIIFNESYVYNIHSDYIIKPSNKIQIQAPIVIIVDARTTCSSELLINALRKSRPDIYVIGASNTAGSAQLARMSILPKNAILAHFDGITKDAFGHIIDNNVGVVPDSLIHFESYKDLLPYEDRLKGVAIEYLDKQLKMEVKNFSTDIL